MVVIVPAILQINNDLAPSVRHHLTRQLFLDEIIDGYVFDNRIAADVEYPNKIRQLNRRLMVVRSFDDFTNRASLPNWNIPDVTTFVAHGLISVETKTGRGAAIKILEVSWEFLLSHRN